MSPELELPELPEDLVLVRTTELFDNDSVPAGLLRAHRTAGGVWGRLVVRQGSLDFVFEDQADHPISLTEGDHVAIPPARPHRVELTGPAAFVVEFYRSPS